jgi:two-component system, OmpR family, manganese sensing response regulator
MAKLLVVEDDKDFGGILVSWLVSENYVVDRVLNGEEALQRLTNSKYDLLILDWGLPGIQGIGVCEEFRQQGGTTPILFLTGRSDLASRVTGLDTGADGYLSKPFDFRELSARVKALLRRPSDWIDNVLKVQDLSLHLNSHTVDISGNVIELTPREFNLLEFMMRHPDQHFSARSLLDSVWPLDSAFSEDTVRQCMRSLRKKISGAGQDCLIKTVTGYGYILNKGRQEPDLA